MRRMIIFFLCIILTREIHSQTNLSVDTMSVELSPKRNIMVLHINYGSIDSNKIWLVDQTDTTKIFLLDSTSFMNTELIFSPDQEWLAENIELVSNFRTIRLFRRIEGVKYSIVNDALIHEKALKLLQETEHLVWLPEFGHSYAGLISWLPNSKAFLMTINGWDDSHGIIANGWSCLFNVYSLKATLDLQKLNKNTVRRNQ
jgi:hypothetical protein